MYCILVTGIPAAGKSTMARKLSKELDLPVISKDDIKEIMFDDVGFKSREEKVALGVAAMNIMYYIAEQFMKLNKPFILENNFEYSSKEGLYHILDKYSYKAITVTLTGDYEKIYERYAIRNNSPERHRGHVVNDCYPEREIDKGKFVPAIPFESYVEAFVGRGMDSFVGNGPQIKVDTSNLEHIDVSELVEKIKQCI